MSSLALFCLPASAYVLDDFNSNVKTGWTDALNGGSVTVGAKQFTIVTKAATGAQTSSLKTASPIATNLPSNGQFSIATGHTLEFRVNVVGSPLPANPDSNTLAVLAFVPVGGGVLTNGYSLAVGRHDFQIAKNGNVLFAIDPSIVNTNWRNTNITMVLRLVESSGSVDINGRVYKGDPSPVLGIGQQTYTELFEWTTNDASGLVGVAGNAGLGVTNYLSPSGSTVVFDNLFVFDIQNKVFFDDFSGDNTTLANNWVIVKSTGAATVNEASGVVKCSAPAAGAGNYSGCFYQGRTFQVVDGGKVELFVDLVTDGGNNANFPVLGYFPGGSAGASSLSEYFIAPSPSAGIYNGKQYASFSAVDLARPVYGTAGAIATVNNFRMFVTLTGETNEINGGGMVRLETRIENLSPLTPVNSSNRIVFEHVVLDTIAQDAWTQGEQNGVNLPYLNINGNFGITIYEAAQAPVSATYDNAGVNSTPQPVVQPIISQIVPTPGEGVGGDPKFLPSSQTVSFHATDVANIPLANMVLTLNGVRYTNGSPGVTITPSTVFSPFRDFVLTGALSANVNYVGTIAVTGPIPPGLTATRSLNFDTFPTTAFVLEMEEYNFTTNFFDNGVNLVPVGPAGVFLDAPELVAEGFTDPCCAYNGQQGVEGIDFHSNHGAHSGYDATHTFRTDDPVRTAQASDDRRAYLIAAGPSGESGFNEEAVTGLHDGDWQNYTKSIFPSGYFNVFLRHAQSANLSVSQSTLERVTSDPTLGSQTATTLGSFLGAPLGLGFYRNLPLTDGVGKPIVLHLAGGTDTVRLTGRATGNDSDELGRMGDNYLVFLPTTTPPTQGPIVSRVSPPPGYSIQNESRPTTATILNRDTAVDFSTIAMKINGSPVTITKTLTSTGAEVSWSLSVLPPARVITNSLIFADTAAVFQTNIWTSSYVYLAASNSLPFNAMTNRGWDVRMVQIDLPTISDNTIIVAELMLERPPAIVPDPDFSVDPTNRLWQTNVMTLDWNDNTGIPKPVPGLDNGPSGWTWPNPNLNDDNPPANNYNYIATECFGYMQLKAGAHRFYIRSDDSLKLQSGATVADPNAKIIASQDGSYFVPVDFIVEADGLYPARAVWQEERGGAEFHISQVNPDTAVERILNDDSGDQSDPNLVKVFYPSVVTLYSSPTVNGTYTQDLTGVVDPAAQTVTVPQSGAHQFYKIGGVVPSRITKVSRSGSNTVLTYKLYTQPGY